MPLELLAAAKEVGKTVKEAIEKTGEAGLEKGKQIGEKIKEASESDISELANKSIEDIKNAGDGVMSKLDEIKNLTPEQLQERMEQNLEQAKESPNENIEYNEKQNETRELSEDEINENQEIAIKEALEKIRNGEKLTKEELGNLGEMMMDQYYISKGYTPLNKQRVTGLDDKKEGFKTGIDGVYEKTNPDGTKTYSIVDAKYNTSQLSETNDGKQMSDNWIEKRLDGAVGKEKADEIRDAFEDDPNSVRHEVYHIDPNIDENGNIHTDIQEVDSEGNKIGEKIIVEYFDADGNRIEPLENI